jgi:hypothetical protein
MRRRQGEEPAKPTNLGARLSGRGHDWCPSVAGQELLFSRPGEENFRTALGTPGIYEPR